MRLSWMLSAGAIGISGFVISGATHENLADRVSNANPGTVSISYYQPAPGLGKLLSLACASGVAGCLWMGLKESDKLVVSAGVPKQLSSSSSVSVPAELPATNAQLVQAVQEVSVFERIYSHHKRHLLIPGETGGGKTTLLLGAIDWIWERTKGSAEFFGSTAKASPWMGLEDQITEDGMPRIINLASDTPESIHPLLQRLRWLQRRMVGRQQERSKLESQGQKANFNRIYIILDEWLQTLAIAKKYDRKFDLEKSKEEPKSDTYGELMELIECFVQCGREDEFCLWLFGQDHQVQNAKINTGYTKSFGIIVLGRRGSLHGLEDALTGRSPITTPSRGKELLAQAEALAERSNSAIAYCNIVGHELLTVPYLPDIKRKRIFAATASSKVIEFPSKKSSNHEISDPWADTP